MLLQVYEVKYVYCTIYDKDKIRFDNGHIKYSREGKMSFIV